MACYAIHSWTVSLFIASFLKLALACLLLWVAWVSFIAAKFMSFFGLHLPCTCNDFIEDQNSGVENICVQAALVDCPSRMISTIGSSVLHRFPFEGICTRERCCSSSIVNTRVVNNRSIDGPFDRSSAGRKILSSDPYHWNSVGPEDWQSINRRASLETQDMQTEITEVKSDYCSCHEVEEGKVCCQQGRCPHCFGNSFHNNGNCRWSSKWKVNQGTLHDGEASPSGLHGDEQNTVIGEGGTRSCEDRMPINELPGASDAYTTSTEKRDLTSEDLCRPERTLSLIDLDGLVNSGEEIGEQGDLLKALDSAAREQISQGNKQDVLNDFIEALGAEREARKALYLELEKERNAAATAAEETMAMISRLQKEKASIEMEARQFKSIAEEKSVYDEEAIEILKEILVRREREKLDLEDEVDMYRQSLLRDGTDKWERISCNESEYSKENNKPSLQEGHESMFLIGREFDCFERQKAGADENNSLNMDVRPRAEKQLDDYTDKPHGKAKHVAPFDGRDLLKSFHLVANENSPNGTDEYQVPQTEGHMISFASQDPKGRAFLENDNQELGKPIKVAMDKDLRQQQYGRKDLLEKMTRSEEQPGLMHSREARVMNSFVKEGGLQLEKYFSERNRLEILSQQEDDDMKGSFNGNGLYESDVGRLHMTEDISNHTLEDDSSTRDVHVVLDDIQTSTKSDSEDTKVSSLKTASDRHEISGLLKSIAEQDEILLTVQKNVLMESNRAGISSGYENENPTPNESKAGKTGLDLMSGYLHKNRLERTSSHGLHVKSLLLRDNARMKVENEVEDLAERLRALEASRENAILPVENVQKEKSQLQHLEEITQHHRDMQHQRMD